MSLPDRNQPHGRTIAPVSVHRSLGQPLSLILFDGSLGERRRRNVLFLVDARLAPTWDTLLLVVPLETSRTRQQ